jgi:hypothetical protein
VLPVLIDMFSRRAAAYERMAAETAD